MKVYSEDFRITSFLVNLRQRAGLYAVLNLIQDVGWQHAVHLGFDLSTRGLAWVFTRQKLVMTAWPEWNEVVTLRTWLRPLANSPFVFRDYELLIGTRKIGECTSSFTVIETESRKLARPDWSSFAHVWREEENLNLAPGKISPRTDMEDLAKFEVRNSDIDLNNHVNNTKYAQWILDAVPMQSLKTAELHEYEINFLGETKMGDEVTLQQAAPAAGDTHAYFQGLRKSDGKVVFTASMKVSL